MTSESKQIGLWLGKLHFTVLLGASIGLALLGNADEDGVRDVNTSQHDNKQSTHSDERILYHSTPFYRDVALYEFLNNSDEQALRKFLNGLFEESERNPVGERNRINEVVFISASRFALINPEEALILAKSVPLHVRTPMLKGIFTEWCVSDLDKAVAAAANLDRDSSRTALDTIATVRDDLSDEQLRGIALELGYPDYVAHMNSEAKTVELTDDPITAWNVLAHDGLNNASQLNLFVLVAEAAIEEQGLDSLFHLRASFADDISYNELFGSRSEIFGAVVDRLVRNDPQGTWAYIESGPTETQETSSEQSNPDDQGEVSARDRAYMTDVVKQLLLQSWAIVDPAAVIDGIEQVPHHLQPLACEHALGELARTEPERSVELVQTLKHLGAGKYRALRGIVEQWSVSDPYSALDWVQSASDIEPESLEELLTPALYSLVLEDPKEATKIAAAQPNSRRLEAFVITELAKHDLDTAIEFLPTVSESARSLSTAWVSWEAIRQGEGDRGVKLLSEFEQSSEEEVNWFMFFLTWSRENPVQLYERMDAMTPKLRYEAAHALDYYSEPELSQEQLDYIRTIYDKSQQ